MQRARWGVPPVLVAWLVAWFVVPLAAAQPASAWDEAAVGAPAATPELQLAQRYVPYIDVQRHDTVCGPGEPYVPTSADTVLGQPDVTLHDGSGRVLVTAPTAADLYRAGPDTYLDLPGDPLDPGCDYETRFSESAVRPPVVVYARVLTDPSDGRLALQYWLYWVFNDWNDRHESDWEMIQIAFDVHTVADALRRSPTAVGVTQHMGNERQKWRHVRLVGDRPVIYAATGSHSMYFEPRRWFGKDADAGFGCDDTRGPSTRLDPSVVLLPDHVTGAQDPFAWIDFVGRWGQHEPSFNDGPTGPKDNVQWRRPSRWMHDARTGAISVPPFGSAVTDFFCAGATTGSRIYIRSIREPHVVWGVGLAIAAVIALLFFSTRWRPAFAAPVRAPRRGGQIMRSAWKLLVSRRRRFVPLAFLAVAGGLLAVVLQLVVTQIPVVHDQTIEVQGDAASRLFLALVDGALVTIPLSTLVFAGAIVAARAERDLGVRTTWRAIREQRILPVVFMLTAAFLVISPFVPLLGVVLAGRWAVAPLTASETDSVTGALRRSAALTRGRRIRVATLSTVCIAATLTAGPCIGALVLVFSDRSFAFVNLVAAVVTAVLLPWLAVVVTMMYEDLDLRYTASHPQVG